MSKKSIALGCVLFACSGENLYVGSDSSSERLVPAFDAGGTGATGGTGAGGSTAQAPAAQWPAQSGCRSDPALAGLVGTWDGNLEDFYLRPVEHVRIVINGASSDGMCGTITWGEKSPLPPAADPNALYPSTDYWTPFGYGGAPAQYLPPVEGFPYTITDSGERLPTLRLGVIQSEPWRGWCELQTPVHVDDQSRAATNGWACDHVEAECDQSPNISVAEQFMCGACEATGPLCTCDEASCDVVQASKQAFDLTLSDDGQTLTGAFQPAYALPQPAWEGGNTSFYLTRVTP